MIPPVPHHPRYVLGGQFNKMHGMDVDQALSGHWLDHSREVMPPEAHEEYWKPVFKQKYKPWAEQVQEATAVKHEPEALLRDWAMDHRTFLVGMNVPKIAGRVRDLTRLMQEAVPNENTIYRGSKRSPQEDIASEPDYPLSFTEDRHVATSFRAQYGKRGAIFKMAPHTARGLRFQDYGVNTRTVGQSRRKESEFLVDPLSFPAGTA